MVPPSQTIGEEIDGAIDEMWTNSTNQIVDIDAPAENWKAQVLPLARIKKIMKSEEAVQAELERYRLQQAPAATTAAAVAGQPPSTTRFMIAGEAPILLGKACELIIKEITVRAWRHTERNRRRTLQRQDIHAAVGESEVYDFLIDIVPRITTTTATVAGAGGAQKGFVTAPPGTVNVNGNPNVNGNVNVNPVVAAADPAAIMQHHHQQQQQQQQGGYVQNMAHSHQSHNLHVPNNNVNGPPVAVAANQVGQEQHQQQQQQSIAGHSGTQQQPGGGMIIHDAGARYAHLQQVQEQMQGHYMMMQHSRMGAAGAANPDPNGGPPGQVGVAPAPPPAVQQHHVPATLHPNHPQTQQGAPMMMNPSLAAAATAQDHYLSHGAATHAPGPWGSAPANSNPPPATGL